MFNEIVELIKQLNKASRRSKNETEALNQYMQQQYYLMRIRQMMLGMTKELYTCFRGKNYPCIQGITQPSDIRIRNFYQADNGKTVYEFSLQKRVSQPLKQVELNELRRLMNDDIRYKISELQCNYEVGILFQFPYLVQGMCVVGVGNDSGLEIHIYISY
ncbi:MAG: hypothetical protein K5678_05165 [Acetatifactor sp.]|nr:hypothetical protein [Acetatifactor sp.]